MNTATFVGRYLAARGVKRAFGHPGSDVMDLIDGLDRAGIDFILTHHENTGAFMANVTGQLTGVPGVVLVTKGPGVTNVTAGIAAAHLDRAPQLCFSSHIDEETAKTFVHQYVPVVPFIAPISKLSEELTAANVHELLPRAVRTAISGRPGSAYLPSSATQQTAELSLPDAELEAIIQRAVEPDPLSLPDVSAAAREIAAARKVMVVVGPGVNAGNASADLIDLLEVLGAPVCVTPEAVGQVPADHPLYVGLYGWHDAPLVRLLDSADLVLTIGLDGWDMLVTYQGTARIISLATVEARDPTFQPAAHALEGDLPRMMRAVSELGVGPRDWGTEQAAAARAEIAADLGVTPGHDPSIGIPPQTVLNELRAVAPRDTIFSCDVGAHKALSCAVWKGYGPKTFYVSNGLSPMGVGLAFAMAAKLEQPGKPVVSVVGDGGFMMYAGELATWARLKLPLVLVVMVDGNLTQVQRRQERKGYSLKSTTFQQVDFCGLARTFGIDAIRATNDADYKQAVGKALAANRPVLIEAKLDPGEYRRIPGAP
jgi:acetolactate synthase I/II/III large subunit